jgi:hypothetical protein
MVSGKASGGGPYPVLLVLKIQVLISHDVEEVEEGVHQVAENDGLPHSPLVL